MKLFLQLFILTVTWTIAACANPTNTQTNPIQKYTNRLNDVPESERGKDKVVPPGEDDGTPRACPKPYAMTITDAAGNDAGRSLQFIVGQRKAYKIDLTSTQSQDLSLRLPGNSPKGLELNKSKSGAWILSFKPEIVQDNLTQKIPLLVEIPQTGCVQGNESENLSVNVNDGQPLPSVAIQKLDQTRRYQSADKISFDVVVTDPALINGKSPNFPEFTYKNTFGTGETIFASAENAITCQPPTKISEVSYRFNCAVDAGKIKNPYPTQPFANTSFQVYARSVNNDLSDEQDASLTFQYPVNLPPPTAADAPTPSSDSIAKKPTKTADKKVRKKKKLKKTKTASSSSKSSSSKDKTGDNT